MKKTQILAIAALAAAVTFQTAAKAEDPVSPVPGAVCNLYLMGVSIDNDPKPFNELASSLPREPAAATFVDSASDFLATEKQGGIKSNIGMWTGWLKQEKAGTYTFLCRRGWTYSANGYRYSIWVNDHKCVESDYGQCSFNVDLVAGFNSVKIVTESYYTDKSYPLSITYKKAGGLKESMSFGPADMFHDDEE